MCLSRPYPSKVFKGFPPQILLGPFLNTLPHITLPITTVFLVDFERNTLNSVDSRKWHMLIL